MAYYSFLNGRIDELQRWLELRKEQGADTDALVEDLRREIDRLEGRLRKMNGDPALAAAEPNDLKAIQSLRPRGPRVMELALTKDQLEDRILGAYLGRGAGCTLGIPVEGMNRPQIKRACEVYKLPYPLKDYWKFNPRSGRIPEPWHVHYGVTPQWRFYKGNLDRIGSDDDIIYTLLGLLILEDFGLDFTMEDVGKGWLKYLPHACTAEHIALENLRAGLKPPKTAETNNPFVEWIGADIRSDPWGYACPGMPERAADFAWRDARVSHQRNGVYGEMFFSAAIAAAFAAKDVREAVEVGLTEIPKGCRLQKDIRKTLQWCDKDGDWDTTLDRIYKAFDGMHVVHTNNNAAVTVAGLIYGEGDLEKTISLTVMGGWDTDCTAATAGSIVGAIRGAKKLPKKWTGPIREKTESYIIGKRHWRNDTIARRFTRVAWANRQTVED